MHTPITTVQVFFNHQKTKKLMGRLLYKDRKIFFEYDNSFTHTGLELSPFKLPNRPGVIASGDRLFNGLFGIFNDSLPDGWGRLLLDRHLMHLGINPHNLSPLDRLCYVGHHNMGALTYEPEQTSDFTSLTQSLDVLAEEARYIQEHGDERFVDDLLSLNGSSAGARPKVILSLNDVPWIIKFRSSIDWEDIGPIEYAYHLMAKAAKLEVPDAKLFPSKKGTGYFGTVRFDREQGQPIHMHTISGLLHANHQEPSLDYETILKTTLWLTKSMAECEKQFRAAAFNVLSHNRDDHAKNFSFLMDAQGTWRVSPAYDLTFSSGPNGEHCSLVMGEGRNPTRTHLLKLARISGISVSTAEQIITEVQDAVAHWVSFATQTGVRPSTLKMIHASLKKIALTF